MAQQPEALPNALIELASKLRTEADISEAAAAELCTLRSANAALRAQVERLQAERGQVVGEAVQCGNPTYTTVVMYSAQVPPGTKLYTSPPAVAQAGGADELREAAQAVIDRWDTPLWKDAKPTAEVIARLRAALAAQPARVALTPLPSDMVDKAQRSMNQSSFEYAGHLIAEFCRINGLTVGITPGDGRAG